MPMEWTDYAEAAIKTAIYPHDCGLLYAVGKLTCEAFELHDAAMKGIEDDNRPHVLEEGGDVFWYAGASLFEAGLPFVTVQPFSSSVEFAEIEFIEDLTMQIWRMATELQQRVLKVYRASRPFSEHDKLQLATDLGVIVDMLVEVIRRCHSDYRWVLAANLEKVQTGYDKLNFDPINRYKSRREGDAIVLVLDTEDADSLYGFVYGYHHPVITIIAQTLKNLLGK